MATNKPVGDNARKGAVKKRTQLKTKLGGATAWTKRNKKSGEFKARINRASNRFVRKAWRALAKEQDWLDSEPVDIAA